jgi:hypothetical protein
MTKLGRIGLVAKPPLKQPVQFHLLRVGLPFSGDCKMRAAHMVLAFALLAGLAGCGKGPQGDTGPRRTCGAR